GRVRHARLWGPPGTPRPPLPAPTPPICARHARSRRRGIPRTDPTASASSAPGSSRGSGPPAGNESRTPGTTRSPARCDARTALGNVTPAHARTARRALASSPGALAPGASLVPWGRVVGPRAAEVAQVPPGPPRPREQFQGLLAAPRGPGWKTVPAVAQPPRAGSSAGASGRPPAGPP